MKFKLVLPLILFMFEPLQASNSCSKRDTFTYRSIECCVSKKLPHKKCTEAIDALDPDFLDSIQNVYSLIQKNTYAYGKAPNCFWTSLSFFNPNISDKPRTWYEKEFMDQLETNYTENKINQLRKHDLIVFEGSHLFQHDLFSGHESTVTLPFHSGVYLGKNIMLQKENSSDSIFSINTVQGSFDSYSEAFQLMKNGPLHIRTFRYQKY